MRRYIFVIRNMNIDVRTHARTHAREFVNDSEFPVNGFFPKHRSHSVFGIIFENLFKFMEKIASQAVTQ